MWRGRRRRRWRRKCKRNRGFAHHLCERSTLVAPAILSPVRFLMYWRRRLPHWVPDDAEVFVTWGLVRLKAGEQREFRLTHPRIAPMLAELIAHGAKDRYELLAWVI